MLSTRSRFSVSFTAASIAVLSLGASGNLWGQPAAGTLERIKVHGASLEGNLEGDDPNREVFVYLPPSYTRARRHRYPVLYFLHGYTATAEAYVRLLELPQAADTAIAAGAGEMIIVLPDAFTAYSGSMYSSSPTIGDWESYISHDLVSYIDAHYRTLAVRDSRGLAGHSMGGYGTVRIGMKKPGVFAALYAMSSCCLLIDPAQGGDAVMRAARERASQTGEGAQAGAEGNGAPPARPNPAAGFANALFAQAAAWAPNPDNPPQYFDLPYKDGELDSLVAAKWLANAPLVMVDQYVPILMGYGALALDVGNVDPLGADTVRLDAALTRLKVAHVFEQYEGDHTNRVRERFATKVLPFFSAQLDFGD
jgi:S-formylglutathione hydrolase FrmB